jgi:CRP-like cAMP-binding protein
LIESLPPSERQHVLSQCELIHLVAGEILCDTKQPSRYAYFPLDAFVSLIATSTGMSDRQRAAKHSIFDVEVGMAGREGMVGSELVLGVKTIAFQALVQGSGTAYRIPALQFTKLMSDNPTFHRTLLRYIHVLLTQQATSANCLKFHPIRARLARWLLMSHDRAHSDRFRLTQEFLAHMLGVTRIGITLSASDLKKQGVIAYQRGDLQVLDRNRLEEAACSCYSADREIYRSTLRPND